MTPSVLVPDAEATRADLREALARWLSQRDGYRLWGSPDGYRVEADRLIAGPLSTLTAGKAAAEAALAERDQRIAALERALAGVLPPRLCAESWGRPDGEFVHTRMTLGALKAARTALSRPVTDPTTGGDDADRT